METQPPALSAHRRSDRVAIAFPIEVAGIDLNGRRFSERTKTTTVSRYGCALTLPRELQPDQAIRLRRIGTNEEAVGRIVGPMGTQPDGRVYGVGTREPCETLWGIRFSSTLSGKLLDTLQDGIYFVNLERRITYWNEGAQQLSGYSATEAVGKSCFNNLLGHVDKSGRPLCLKGCQLSQVLADGEPREAEIYLRHKEGYRVPVKVKVMPMRDGTGKIVGAVEIFNEPTVKNKVEKRVSELVQLALHDSLTGLPNRRYIEMKVEQGLEEQRRFDRLFGLLMIDLDGFKRVNDSHGHTVGDALLKAVGHTLTKGVRPLDITGRWGGEEFLVLMPDIDAIELGDLAERCRVMIAQSSIVTDSARVSVTASIGATVLNHDDSAESAIRRADELMYQSKHSGGDRTTAG